MASSCVSFCGGEGKFPVSFSSYEATNLIPRTPNTVTLGVGLEHMDVKGPLVTCVPQRWHKGTERTLLLLGSGKGVVYRADDTVEVEPTDSALERTEQLLVWLRTGVLQLDRSGSNSNFIVILSDLTLYASVVSPVKL
jgi:hypothetical protein